MKSHHRDAHRVRSVLAYIGLWLAGGFPCWARVGSLPGEFFIEERTGHAHQGSPEHLQFIGPPARGACLVFITENLDPELIEHSYRRWVVLEGEPDALPRDEIETIQIASEFPPMVPVVNQGTAR